jgi:hypothetical protein
MLTMGRFCLEHEEKHPLHELSLDVLLAAVVCRNEPEPTQSADSIDSAVRH